jgi:hypothetical protein
MAGEHLVDAVDERAGPERSQAATERPRQPQLGEHSDPASVVAGEGRAVAQDEPPALVPPLVRDRLEQALRRLVGQREQRELLLSVERDDDPRRPAAELSAAVEEQDGSQQRLGHAESVLRRKPPWCA